MSSTPKAISHYYLSVVLLLLLHLCTVDVTIAQTSTFEDYHSRVKQAVGAIDTLAAVDESESTSSYDDRLAQTIERVLSILPAAEKVSWDDGDIIVDNKWLHEELARHSKAADPARRQGIQSVAERLQAIDERLEEMKHTQNKGNLKAATAAKIREILERPEYAGPGAQQSALAKLWRDFIKWLQQLIPKRQPLAPGSANLFTKFAQIFVIVLALAVIAYVLRTFAPALFNRRNQAKTRKRGPLVVLGEELARDQSAGDLLNEAEALARQGDVRSAIRKTYVALLVELGDRKVLSLAQHKTNRDYLRAVRSEKPLYEIMKRLTESFERHWYGFARATEADWIDFRTEYSKAVEG